MFGGLIAGVGCCGSWVVSTFVFQVSSCFFLHQTSIHSSVMKIRGGGLMFAVGITFFLVCAYNPNTYPYFDPKIFQVTDHNHILGTPEEYRFNIFIQEFRNKFSTRDEYLYRLGIFARNLITAGEHQVLDPGADHGDMYFFNLPAEKFESVYMGVKGGAVTEESENEYVVEELEVGDLHESIVWREKGEVTKIKLQGSSELCGAFSITRAFEGIDEEAMYLDFGKQLKRAREEGKRMMIEDLEIKDEEQGESKKKKSKEAEPRSSKEAEDLEGEEAAKGSLSDIV